MSGGTKRVARSHDGETSTLIAAALKVEPRTVRRWAASGMPAGKGGASHLAKIRAWRADRSRQRAREKAARPLPDADPAIHGEPSTDEEKRWATEWRRIRVLRAKMDLGREQGDLVPRKEVISLFVERVAVVRSALMALPRRMAPRLVGMELRQIEAELESACRSILESYARPQEGLTSEPKDDHATGDAGSSS